MKNLILITVIGFALMSCTSEVKNQDENIELIENYIHSVEKLDYDAMANLLDDNYLGLGPSYGDSIGKVGAVENWKYNVSNLYESIHFNKSRFAAVSIPDGENKGEWVTNWAELNIVYKAGLDSVVIWANTNYLIENEKIVRSISFYNEADALRQLGYSMVRK